MINQLSVFVENRNGAIMEVTGILCGSGIDLRAMSIADSRDFGVVRLLVDRPEAARDLLKENGITSTLTPVIGVEVPDRPGTFHKMLTALYEAEIMVEYTYAFVAPETGTAYAILRVPDVDLAAKAITGVGMRLLQDEEVYRI